MARVYDERNAQLTQPPAYRCPAAVAEVKVDHGRREMWMFGGIQTRFDIPGGHDAATCTAQRLVDFERDEGLILDEEDQPSGERTS